MISYLIEPDLELWVPVPRSFPEDEWQTAEQWADDLAEVAIEGDPSLKQIYRNMALDVAANQVEEADHTLWYSPEDGHAMGTAHLIIQDDDDEEATLRNLATPAYESLTPPQFEEFKSAVFGNIVQASSVITVDLPREDETVMLPAVGHVRTVARGHGLVFILEAYDSDLSSLALMMEPMVDVLETVSFEESDAMGNTHFDQS